MSEFPNLEMEVKVREEGLGFIVFGGIKELKIARDLVLSNKGDEQYYDSIRKFITELEEYYE